jgi:hypothetical protein
MMQKAMMLLLFLQGYEGPMPADHPPTGKQQQQQGIGPVLAGAAPLPSPAAAAAVAAGSAAAVGRGPQHVFVNGQIWTADPQVSPESASNRWERYY